MESDPGETMPKNPDASHAFTWIRCAGGQRLALGKQ
jgi:hypothetical protein